MPLNAATISIALKRGVAVALAAALSSFAPFAASEALAAPTQEAPAAHPHKTAKPAKGRPASTKATAVGRRKHTIDTKPDSHGPAIAMSKPLDAPKVDAKKMDGKKADPMKKDGGKKRESRRSVAKKADAKKGDGKQAVPVVAAAIAAPLPPLPGDEAQAPEGARKPITINGRVKHSSKPPCLQPAVNVVRGTEESRISLAKCDGAAAPDAVEKLATLLRASDAVAGTRIDAKLVERLGMVAQHFHRQDVEMKIAVVSGYRPSSAGSYHASGRAIDFRIDGIRNEDVVAYCKTLEDTGCGYYPNSSFVHLDVRDPGTGHVAWIDASGPGEAPRYVASWPPPQEDLHAKKDSRAMIEDLLATLEKELPRVPADDHPAEAGDLPAPKAEIARELP